MKILLKSLATLCMLISFFVPSKVFAADTEETQTTYISVSANGYLQPGIYKMTNTTLQPIIKGNVYKAHSKNFPGYNLEITQGKKVSYKKSNGFNAESYITTPYNYPVAVGNTIYFTKFVKKFYYGSYQCGGGTENIFNLYKIENGKVSKVNNDAISDGQGNPLYSSNGNLYYIVGKGLNSSYQVVELSTTGEKTTLLKNVSDFWMDGSQAYYQKSGKIYNFNLETKKSIVIKKSMKRDFYSNSICEEANYSKVTSGLLYEDFDEDFNYIYYFYNYSTGQSTKLSISSVYILDLSISNNLSLVYNSDKEKYYIYNLDGKKLKTLSIPENSQFLSVSLDDHKITYLSGTKVEILSF